VNVLLKAIQTALLKERMRFTKNTRPIIIHMAAPLVIISQTPCRHPYRYSSKERNSVMTNVSQGIPNNPKKKKGKKKWVWIALIVLLTFIGYAVFSARSRIDSAYQEETAALRDISTYYSFSGHLSPITDELQTAKAPLKVKELYVREGDAVVGGQPLLRGTDGSRIFAVATGIVDNLYVESDDQLQSGSQIARIVNYNALEVSVDVDEYDIGALSLGKQGTVYLNALGREVIGAVNEIARNATTSGGVSYYAVKMEIEATEDIRSGMSVEVNVLNHQALNAVSVATKVISYDEYNKPFVFVKAEDGQIVPRYVMLGVSDGLYTQISEGLEEGETVYYMESNTMRFFMMRPGGIGGSRNN